MRGQTRWSPVLVQRAVSEDPRWTRAVSEDPRWTRAVSEDPRWTRAVGDHTSPPSRKTMKECGLDARSEG